MRTGSGHERLGRMLGAFALGALDDDDCRLIEAHLRLCRACREELRSLEQAVEHLGPVPEAPPTEVWERVEREIRRRAADGGTRPSPHSDRGEGQRP